MFVLQLLALSIGPIGYRLTIDPYITVAKLTSGGWTLASGLGTSFSLLLGDDNRMPERLAINLVAVAALVATFWPEGYRDLAG